MAVPRIAINGFGRIGRIAFRIAAQNKTIQVVAINDLLDVDHLAYLLQYDSNHPIRTSRGREKGFYRILSLGLKSSL